MIMQRFVFLALVSAALAAAADVPRLNSTIRQKIMDEQRFVVFNSRRLTGECRKYC
jgi:hypothetical protein